MRLLVGLGPFQRDDLRLGQDQALLGHLGFQRLEPVLHGLQGRGAARPSARRRARSRSRPWPVRSTALSDLALAASLAVVGSGYEQPVPIFNSSPEVIRLVVMMYVRYPLSLRNVEDLLAERGIDISHETVRFWWNRFGPIFAAKIRKRRVAHMRGYPQWRWHLDEAFVKVNGKLCYLWRAVDHEGECWRRWSPQSGTRLRRWSCSSGS